MARSAAYDEIAEWYETRFLPGQGEDDPLGVTRGLRSLLGAGQGTCLEIGCGTGVHAATLRALGWQPLGVDISAGMLRWARGRLPVVRADVERLPFASGTFPAVAAVMVHTDMPAYPAIVREVARVLAPGGRFVHIGVGATHWPLPHLLAAFVDAGLVLERFVEGGEPTPVMLGVRARKPEQSRN